jgi:hypothetical protein
VSASRSKNEGPIERSILESALTGETMEKCEDRSGTRRTKREEEDIASRGPGDTRSASPQKPLDTMRDLVSQDSEEIWDEAN